MHLDHESAFAGIEFRLIDRRRLLVETGGIGQIAGAGRTLRGQTEKRERGGERDACLKFHDTSLESRWKPG